MQYMIRFAATKYWTSILLLETRKTPNISVTKSFSERNHPGMSSEIESKTGGAGACEDISATSLEEAKKKYEFFWGNTSPFSQHHAASFKIDEMEFNCAEQYMMYQKAVLFEDQEIAEEVRKSKDPKYQKSLGRKVKNFDVAIWKENCVAVVETANIAKFSQNAHLKKQLLATYPKILVEASPNDTVWGIGLAKDNPKAWNEKTWRGTNLLGTIISDVRKKIMAQESSENECHSGAQEKAENESTTETSKPVGGATSLKEAKMKYEYFWKKTSPFSQWHRSAFEIGKTEFIWAEQYMMYQKAVLFGDKESADRILKSKDPQQQKSLGRKVKNFDQEKWNQNCRRIVEEGNMAKFSQNAHLKRQLLATHPKILVEASPVDTVWGIGYAEDHVNAWDERSWKGTNYLGYALTGVRDKLMEPEKTETKKPERKSGASEESGTLEPEKTETKKPERKSGASEESGTLEPEKTETKEPKRKSGASEESGGATSSDVK